jgi:hypothetical protein
MVGVAGRRHDDVELAQRNIGVDAQRPRQAERADAADRMARRLEHLGAVEHLRLGGEAILELAVVEARPRRPSRSG